MDLKPPAEVAAVARAALAMRDEQAPSNRGGTAVGVKRANQLASRENLSINTVKRMASFFARHEVDKQATGFRKGEDGFPSKGRQAWDLWGGDPGRAWAEKMLRKLEKADASPQTEEKTVIDVNVLTGADVRRIDGKFGKVAKVSMPWVTVRWENGVEESYLRSDEALAEDIELKTLDKGWLSLGAVVGTEEVQAKAAQESVEKSTAQLLAETRVMARRMNEQYRSFVQRMKVLSEKNKAANPFVNHKTLGTNTEKKVKRSETKMWKCSGSEFTQTCVAQRDDEEQGIKKGQEKVINIDPAYKKKYMAAYILSRKQGKTAAPDGKKGPVSLKHYNSQYEKDADALEKEQKKKKGSKAAKLKAKLKAKKAAKRAK